MRAGAALILIGGAWPAGCAGPDTAGPEARIRSIPASRADGWVRKAVAAADAGRWEDALGALGRAADLAPHRGDIRKLLADVQLRLGHLAEAVRAAREGLAIEPDSVPLKHVLAQGLRLSGAFEASWRLYGEVAAANPGDAIVVREMADLAMLRGDFEAAAEGYRTLLGAGARSATVLGNLAAAELERGHVEEARRCAAEAVRLSPSDGLPHKTLGLALARLGREEEALEELERARRLAPSRPDPLVAIAQVRAARGEWAAARGAYEELLRRYRAGRRTAPVEALWRLLLSADDPGAALAARIDEARRGETRAAGEEER